MNKRLTLLLLTALLALPTSANAATYSASYSAPDADWSYNENGATYNRTTFGTATGLGHYNPWSYGGWRLDTPDKTVAISSIRLIGSLSTTNSAFHARIRTGIGSQGTTQFDTTHDGAFNHTYGGTFSWVQAELYTPSGTDTGSVNTNLIGVSSSTVTFTDNTAPALTVGVPAAGWHAAGCIPFSYAASDTGSRIWTATAVDTTTGQTIDSYQSTRHLPAQPGTLSIARTACVSGTGEGTHTITVTATDYAGTPTRSSFAVKFDLTGPDITSSVSEQQHFSTYRPTMNFGITDGLSGVASTEATIDGQGVWNGFENGTLTVRPDALTLGPHTVSVTATDNVGNTHRVSRDFVITDATAPTVTINSPGSIGDNTPVLDVQAADDKSGVDPASWTVTVDGQQLIANASNNRVLVDIGYLVTQTHLITIRVRDESGNVTTKSTTYVARTFPGATPLPGINGLYSVVPRKRVRVGQTIRIKTAGALHGRPLAGLRAEIQQNGRTIAGKIIGLDGTVDIQTKLYYRKNLSIVVEGSGLPPKRVKLRWR